MRFAEELLKMLHVGHGYSECIILRRLGARQSTVWLCCALLAFQVRSRKEVHVQTVAVLKH